MTRAERALDDDLGSRLHEVESVLHGGWINADTIDQSSLIPAAFK